MAHFMKKTILNILQFLIIFLFLFWSSSFAQEAGNQEASQLDSYDFELKGITLEQTIRDLENQASS